YQAFAPPVDDRGEDLDNLFHGLTHGFAVRAETSEGRLSLWPYAALLYKEELHCIAAVAADPSHVDVFAMSHLGTLRCVESERFEVPLDFEVRRFVQGHFGLFEARGPCERVVVDFEGEVGEQLRRRALHPSQRFETLADGRVRMSFELFDLGEVTGWLLGFGPAAQVVAPSRLQRHIRETLAASLARYDLVQFEDA
ncbi:MAG: WYL domain-containing protein, partial [Myxococcota bacterium]